MNPYVYLDLHVSKFSPDGNANDYYNRYDYDVKMLDDGKDEDVLIGKGTAFFFRVEEEVS